MQLWAIEFFVSLVSVATQYSVLATKEAVLYAAEKVLITADLASRSSSCVTCRESVQVFLEADDHRLPTLHLTRSYITAHALRSRCP